ERIFERLNKRKQTESRRSNDK
ncbi:F0F1 ATP synthase subunit epsilon, partial [Escherichia coli]|nr:F0F1 ATP synthase subunit epsilon [Escherichia coli]